MFFLLKIKVDIILEFQNFANVIYIISPDIFTPEKLGLVLGGWQTANFKKAYLK
jgi:hypothetical protein